MQVIEKVKVVPEGYNGAGMDGMYCRRDVNGKANAGLTLGIIGTALGAWALFGNRRSTGVLGEIECTNELMISLLVAVVEEAVVAVAEEE